MDGQFRAEVEAAARHGVPLSVFRDWSPEDQAVAVALVVEEWDTCGGCGHPLSETTAPGASGRYSYAQALCAGCEIRAAADKEPHYPGRLVHVTRKPD